MSLLTSKIFTESAPTVWQAAGLFALAVLALQSARVIYFAFCSPLSQVPGPLICKLTGAVDTYQAIVGGRRAEWMHSLHQVYGKQTFV